MADAASIFRGIAKDPREGLVLKPLLHSYLFDAEWAGDFSIEFKKGSDRRVPDGWFHPSEHPRWPERRLYYYMTQPEAMIGENFAYMSTLSVTMGKAMHGFIESCLQHLGLLLTTDELRDLGFDVNPKDGEPSVSRPDTNSRGHMDGILKVHLPRWPTAPYHHFEFKTSNNMKLGKIKDLDLDAFIEKWPDYYAQAQEYLRMTGLQVSVVLFLGMGFPWEIREFHIPANPQYQADTANKYRSVMAHAEKGIVPQPCCSPRSAEAKDCPARAVCPVGLA
mgnify:FL=1